MKKDNLMWVDFIRVVSVFLVVLLHVAAPLVGKYTDISAHTWWAGNVYDSFSRVSVPMLFMLSGYLLLGKQETIREYFTKRVKKILLPMITWSMIYLFWDGYRTGVSVTWLKVLSVMFIPAYYHLWFLYTLLGLYLYMPILRLLVANSQGRLLYYFSALWFVSVSVMPGLQTITGFNSTVDLQMISGFVGYLVLGKLLGEIDINKKQFLYAVLIWLICLMVTIVATFIFTIRNGGDFIGYFYGYLSPNVIVFSGASFIMLRYLFSQVDFQGGEKTLALFSSSSFGVYLIHPIIKFMIGAGWFGFVFNEVYRPGSFISVPVMAFLVYFISLFFILLIRRMPFVKYIVT